MALFRIAHALHKSVDEMEQLSWSELSEWIAFFKILREERDRK